MNYLERMAESVKHWDIALLCDTISAYSQKIVDRRREKINAEYWEKRLKVLTEEYRNRKVKK